MNHRNIPLAPGLYLCAVPIGNARDITLRSLDILASADMIAAEDTRSARKLMEIHGISLGDRRIVSYHDHSPDTVRSRLIQAVRDGQSVAYVAEAGTPLVADPGFKLVAEMRRQGLPLTAAPGASAALAALSISGLPSDAFHFAGFLSSAKSARRSALEGLRALDATLILYESPKRIHALLTDICETLGGHRNVVVCRELTKKFEEVLSGTVEELAADLDGRSLKGEIVVLIGRGDADVVEEQDVSAALRAAMKTMRIKDAATAVAGATGLPRREVYQIALNLKDDDA